MSRRLRCALVGYGVVLAVLGTAVWVTAFPNAHVWLQTSRQNAIAGSISVLDHGGPPLVVKNGSGYAPAGGGDDEGIYLVLPELGHLTGEKNPVTLFKVLSGAAMGLLVALAPLVAYILLDSLLLAVLAPIWLLANYVVFARRDIYFVNAWIILLGLPVAYLALERPWSRRLALSLLGLAALAASCSNAVRAHAGTGVAVSLAVVAVMRERSWRWRIAGVAVVAACYAAVSPLLLSQIRDHSFAEAHIPPGAAPTAHPLWHPAYLGLGYLPNGWGIRWKDSVALVAAQRVDPNVRYFSPEYEHILRHQYVNIVEHHPGWAVKLYAAKAAALIWTGIKNGGVIVLLLPLALVLGRRPTLRVELLLLIPALVFAAIPPLLTVPQFYDSGFTACLDLAGALALGALLHARLRESPSRLRRRAFAAAAACVACVAAAGVTTQLLAAQVSKQISTAPSRR